MGPVGTALLPGEQRDALSTWRDERVPVVYLLDRPVKKSVINVVAGMGIFGSRLENPQGGDLDTYAWDPDDESGIVQAYAKSTWSAFIARDWADKEILAKTTRLHDSRAKVMDDYSPDLKKNRLKKIKNSKPFQCHLRDAGRRSASLIA